MINRLNVSVEGGKYTIQVDEAGRMRCLRYGEAWRDLTGDKMVLALVHEIRQLREVQCHGQIDEIIK